MEKPIIEKAIRGTLKFLVFNRFYGFITRFDTREDIFVHGSEIRYINPMQFTRRCGDSVIFDLAVGVKGLEAVNVILNLAETEEEEMCDDNDGKDSIYLFDNMNGRFQKLPGGKQPSLVIMKKRNTDESGLDDSVADSEIDLNLKNTADSLSLNTYPSISSLAKYPSISTLSSISYDDSILSWANVNRSGLGDDSCVTPEPISTEPMCIEVDTIVNNMSGVGDELEEDSEASTREDDEVDLERTKSKADPIVDRTNTDYRNENDVDENDDKRFIRTKLTLGELRGKSFKKMHEENMKRRMVQP